MNVVFRLVVPLFALVSALFVALPPPQQGVQIPPEIQKIIDKQAAGKPVTQEEMQKLLSWANQQAGKATSGRSNQAPTAGIPCQVHVSGSYTMEGGDDKEEVTFDALADMQLFARINGKGDYFASLLDSTKESSSFQLMPRFVGAKYEPSGSGTWSYTKTTKNSKEKRETQARFKAPLVGMMLVSTGTDKLFPIGTQLDGESEGTTKITDHGGNEETMDLADGFGTFPKVPFMEVNELNWQPGQPFPKTWNPTITLKEVTDAVTATGQSRIQWSEKLNFTSSRGFKIVGNYTTTIILRPSATPELVVSIENFDTWRPEAGKDEKTPGNRLNITAELKNKNGAPLADALKATKITFKLFNGSREPGVCLNWPEDADPDKPFDMQFEAGQNQGFTVSPDGQVAEKKQAGLAKEKVVLTSFDWGGWSALEVTAETPRGNIVGYLSGMPSETRILLPHRDKGLYIAKAWLKSKGISPKDDAEDEEDIPKGDGHKGDGFALYEEYRGFMELGKHIEGDVKRKDVMILITLKDRRRAQDAIDLFAGQTGFHVHSGFREIEFGEKTPPGATDFRRNKLMNRHKNLGASVVDQHGIVLTEINLPRDAAEAVSKPGIPGHHLGTPKDYQYILIPANFDPKPSGWRTTIAGKAKVLTDYYAVSVAHEILHCVNVYHHGQGDLVPLYARQAMDSNGNLVVTLFKDETINAPWVSVNLREEQGAAIAANDPRWKTVWKDGLQLNIAVAKGQHSGFEDCIMRYDIANAYTTDQTVSAGTTLYYLSHPPGVATELSGIQLCTTPNGTGVNDAARKPRPRYGDAGTTVGTKRAGTCKEQICVNDRYHKP